MLTKLLRQNYETLQEALCFKSQKSDEFCPVETLNSIGTSGFDISYANFQKVMPNPLAALQNIPAPSYCTTCGHAMATGLLKALTIIDTGMKDTVQKWIEKQCGGEIDKSMCVPSLSADECQIQPNLATASTLQSWRTPWSRPHLPRPSHHRPESPTILPAKAISRAATADSQEPASP